MPNPKGHPESLEPYKFKSDRDKSLTEQLNIRITKETSEQLKELGDEKAEFCRDAINKALEERNSKGK
ncbi:hypothetical protein [Fortiea contorta]|uniref:hypothetical protein n=1 Tax=Fortiea contorta TaxID=1892405 RepID=UPI00034D5F80|nr:hypothetical protein [Fortiea contorta]